MCLLVVVNPDAQVTGKMMGKRNTILQVWFLSWEFEFSGGELPSECVNYWRTSSCDFTVLLFQSVLQKEMRWQSLTKCKQQWQDWVNDTNISHLCHTHTHRILSCLFSIVITASFIWYSVFTISNWIINKWATFLENYRFLNIFKD